jgi:hypothetical protein
VLREVLLGAAILPMATILRFLKLVEKTGKVLRVEIYWTGEEGKLYSQRAGTLDEPQCSFGLRT